MVMNFKKKPFASYQMHIFRKGQESLIISMGLRWLQKSSKKGTQVGSTFSRTVCAHEHVQCSEHIQSVWETKVSIWVKVW